MIDQNVQRVVLSLQVATASRFIIQMTTAIPPRKEHCDIKIIDFKRVDISVSKTHSKSNFELCSKMQFSDNLRANVAKIELFQNIKATAKKSIRLICSS